MTPIDYVHLLRSVPALYLVLEPREPFVILDASDSYLRATLTVREQIVGRPLFEVFPDNPGDPAATGVTNLRASLHAVIEKRAPHAMALQRYGIRRPASQGGAFEERWWQPLNTPVLDARGDLQLIIHQVKDDTALVRAREAEQEERARAEAGLQATEVLESITDGFFALDRGYRFLYVNREAERILGQARDALLGRTIWDAYPELAGTGFERAYRGAMDLRQAESITAYYEPHQRWYDVHVYPAPRGISIYFRDVTGQRRAQEEFRRLAEESDTQRRIQEVVLGNTPDLVFIFNTDHRFVYVNASLLAMWGKTREEAIGKTTWELGYPEWEAALHDREIDEVIATRRPIHGEVPFEGATGVRAWDYIFAPVIGPSGDVVAIAGTARDTTERRNAEQALREADRAKDEFIATLSHELRNPLAPLRNSIALLKRGAPEPANDDRLVAIMERQVEHLVRLVEDLLEISRITRGDLVLRRSRTDLARIVRNALETCAPLIEARRHQVEVSEPQTPVWVDADAVRLSQVVANLVDNAAKYTPDGGRIGVHVSHEHEMSVVRVVDNGVGISAEGLQQVFRMFDRGDRSRVAGEGGLGIGLALAKRLVDLHGGTLEAASAGTGRGSEFTLRIPAADAPLSADEPSASADDLARKRILVVDDNVDAADTLGLMLRQMGAAVHVANDGAAAIEAFPHFRPSAVLLDIGMPRMDGYEVARELRSRYPDAEVSIIALTGWGQEQDRARAREAGFDHHIVKPADASALQLLLASVEPPRAGHT